MRHLALTLVLLLLGGSFAAAQQSPAVPREIHGMRYPALSPDGSRIAFSYRGDLWLVPAAGGEAKRVAELPGWDNRVRWSPDGKTLAYSSDVKGNMDLYTLPAEGGAPKQITYHTAEDYLGDWSPDGKTLSFYSARDSRLPMLYSIGLADGRLHEITRDEVSLTAPVFSPDGGSVAYTRGSAGWARKGYRGSANADVYTVELAPDAVPHRLTASTKNEMWPMYSADGKWLYYIADVDGAGSLWKMPVRGGKGSPVAAVPGQYAHYPALSRDGKTLVYEAGFSLWTIDLTARKPEPRRLTVTAAVETAPRQETRTLTNGAGEMEVSPDGNWLALGMSGDLFLVPSGGGDAKQITTSAARDYDVAWAPDGKSLVYVSEREANVDLYLYDVAGGKTRRVTTDPAPDVAPSFSPDGRRLLFTRGNLGARIVTVPVAGGPETVVAEAAAISNPKWSPDGRWIAYSRRELNSLTNVFVRPSTGGEEINVSRWNGFNVQPEWSPDGKRLTYYSSRSGSMEIYTVELSHRSTAALTGDSSAGVAAGASVAVTIDAGGIERRARQLVSDPAGSKGSMAYTPDGKAVLFSAAGGLYEVPVAGGKARKIADGVGGTVRATADGNTLYTLGGRGLIQRVDRTTGAATPVPFRATVTVDLDEQQRQTFDQAWRMMRDSFYDAKMHGVDWTAVRERYRPVVDECASVQDLHLLLTEMIGELNASHTGASRAGEVKVPHETGQLGLWFDWSRDGAGLLVKDVLRDGPADQDDTRIRPGEYVVGIAGKDVAATEEVNKNLAGWVGTPLELLVNARPDRIGARTVKLTPVSRARFADLLYDHWVQRNREEVDRLSGGRLAYLHIREMKQDRLAQFERELLTEAYGKEALVVDVRYNPGGRIHDELFALLTRKVHVYETPRDGLKMTQPFGAFTRPMVLLINQGSFSDAEIFANGFRANGLGKIVGVPTGGGVIGTTNVVLLDGQTEFRVPRTGWHTREGLNLENYGVPPDFYVELSPADLAAGRDPQLEKAVTEVLKAIKSGKR